MKYLIYLCLFTIFNVLNAQYPFRNISYEQALEEATNSHKHVLLYFSDMSAKCNRFERETLSNEMVQEYLVENFICVVYAKKGVQSITIEDTGYGAYGFPWVIALNHFGSLINDTGYLGPNKFWSWAYSARNR